SALSPCVRRSGSLLAAPLDDEDDFDAPVTNQMTSGGAPHHYMVDVDVDDMAMEDECYLGKYGQHEECVDFGETSDPRRERRGRGRDARLRKPEGRGVGEDRAPRRPVRGGPRGQDQVVRAESILRGQVGGASERGARDTHARGGSDRGEGESGTRFEKAYEDARHAETEGKGAARLG
ncbi:hypothetical protein THAOC_12052, partial [Thalassiosira oceanica]